MRLRVSATLFILLACGPAAQAADGGLLLDVEHYDIQVELVPDRSFLRGEAELRLKVLQDTLRLPFELSNRLSVLEVTDSEGTRYPVHFDDFDSSRMIVRGADLFRAGTKMNLRFRFEGSLETQQFAFLDAPRTERAVISPERALLLSEGQWFPSHAFPLDSATATVKVKVPLGFTAVAPGALQEIETAGVTEIFTWHSDQPLTRIPVVVDQFLRQRFDIKPIPLTFFVTREVTRDLQPLAEEIGLMLEFYSGEYGDVPVSSLVLVHVDHEQLPSTGARGVILLEPSLFGPNPNRFELARRVAREWWGHSVRIEQAYDAWLQDGFATYAALRYFEANDPDRFETELARQAVEALKYESNAPVVRGLDLIVGSPQYNSIVASKGAWVLYMLGQLMGREELDALVGEWGRANAGQAASTPQFVDFVQARANGDYRWFFSQWLESVGVPEFRVEYTILKQRAGGYRIRGQIRQNLDLFRMPVELVIETKGEPEEQQLTIGGQSTSFSFETEDQPLGIRLDPRGKILRDSEAMRVAVHLALGEEFQEQGEYVSAIQEFERARDMNPRSSMAHYRLGEVFFEQHSLTNAANSFRESLNGDLKPDWVETWSYIFLGKIYDILGQRQRAMAEYQKAVNSQNDYNGAQAEANKYLEEPYSRPRGIIR